MTRNGEAEAVMLSVDDLEGMEMTLEILGDSEGVGRISESLAALAVVSPALTSTASARTSPAGARHRRVTSQAAQRYEVRFQPAARQAIAPHLPEAIAAAVLELCEAPLNINRGTVIDFLKVGSEHTRSGGQSSACSTGR
ncbi:MAG: hypothetical protein ACYDEY_14910 [Acidimicrobiales bacterium]